MYTLLILFIISLAGIIGIMGRKLKFVREKDLVIGGYSHYFVPEIEEVREMVVYALKKYGHMSVVAMVRMQVKSVNFSKKTYALGKDKLSNLQIMKNRGWGNVSEEVKVSKFLKMVSDYKQKVREIRHRIHEEEKN